MRLGAYNVTTHDGKTYFTVGPSVKYEEPEMEHVRKIIRTILDTEPVNYVTVKISDYDQPRFVYQDIVVDMDNPNLTIFGVDKLTQVDEEYDMNDKEVKLDALKAIAQNIFYSLDAATDEYKDDEDVVKGIADGIRTRVTSGDNNEGGSDKSDVSDDVSRLN